METTPTDPETLSSRLRRIHDHFTSLRLSPPPNPSDPDLPLLLKADPVFTRLHLLNLLLGAASEDPHHLLPRLRSAADSSPLHRRLFVFGPGLLGCTPQSLAAAFSPFGPIEDCFLVPDKANSPSTPPQGYAFVLFAARSSAREALRQPEKLINGQPTTCVLATVQRRAAGGTQGGRLVEIGNVPPEDPTTLPSRLRPILEAFGEIEGGPYATGVYDGLTGKYRGPASVVYRTREAARRAVAEPYKVFEGRLIHCQPAAVPSQGAMLRPGSSSDSRRRDELAKLAAEQNLALYTGEPLMASSRASFWGSGMVMGQPYDLEEEEDGDSDSGPDGILHVLEPFSNDQLIGFLCEAAAASPGLRHRILTAAAHSSLPRRTVVVHGLLNNDQESNCRLRSFFEGFGEIESGPAVGYDHITSRDGGSAMLVYSTERGAKKAVEEPGKVFNGQELLCHLTAAAGPMDAAVAAAAEDMARRCGNVSCVATLRSSAEWRERHLQNGNAAMADDLGRSVASLLSNLRRPAATIGSVFGGSQSP